MLKILLSEIIMLQSFREDYGTTKFPSQGEEKHKARKALPFSSSL